MPFVFIATPMHGGMCHGSYAASLLRLTPTFMNAKVGFLYAFTLNDSLVTRARDGLAADFLKTECSHLMFIDSDIGFAAEDILSMVAADRDIICGVYPRKEINWRQVAEAARAGVPPEELHKHAGVLVVAFAADPDIHDPRMPVEVYAGGTGFMLIKREVLEGLADKVPAYNDANGIGDIVTGVIDGPGKVVRQYFTTSIDPVNGDRLLSEDYHFCKLARGHGYTVWVAPWVELSHTGSYQFTGGLKT